MEDNKRFAHYSCTTIPQQRHSATTTSWHLESCWVCKPRVADRGRTLPSLGLMTLPMLRSGIRRSRRSRLRHIKWVPRRPSGCSSGLRLPTTHRAALSCHPPLSYVHRAVHTRTVLRHGTPVSMLMCRCSRHRPLFLSLFSQVPLACFLPDRAGFASVTWVYPSVGTAFAVCTSHYSRTLSNIMPPSPCRDSSLFRRSRIYRRNEIQCAPGHLFLPLSLVKRACQKGWIA